MKKRSKWHLKVCWLKFLNFTVSNTMLSLIFGLMSVVLSNMRVISQLLRDKEGHLTYFIVVGFCRHSHWCGDGGSSEGCATGKGDKKRIMYL